MPNITVYIKSAIWTQILKVHHGDELAARRWVKALVEGHYAKKTVQTA